MENLPVQEFVKPYPIREFDGELGLSGHDIARGLGVDYRQVSRKLRRGKWYGEKIPPNWLIITTKDIVNNISGVSYDSYYLNTRAAKAFVAKYENDTGNEYLDWLFTCEEKVQQEIPILKTLIQKLLKTRKSKTNKGIFLIREKLVICHTLFGDDYEIQKERIPYDEATDLEKEQYRTKHRQSVLLGLAKAQQKVINPEKMQNVSWLEESKTKKLENSK